MTKRCSNCNARMGGMLGNPANSENPDVCIYCTPEENSQELQVTQEGSNAPQSSSSNSRYASGKSIADIIGLLGWLAVFSGAVITVVGGNRIGLVGVATGLAIVMVGFINIMGAQATKAIMDNADSTRELLEHFRDKTE